MCKRTQYHGSTTLPLERYKNTDPRNFPITDANFGHPRPRKILYDMNYLSLDDIQDIDDMDLIKQLEDQKMINFTCDYQP